MLHRLVVSALAVSMLCLGADLALAQQAAFNPANGHTYKLTPTVADFNAARVAANAEGGYLVAINDAAENQFVLNAFQSFFNAGGTAYIGLTDELTEGIFLWDSGEPLTFTNWNLGQPDDWQAVGGEDYAQMIGDGSWNDNTLNALDVGIIEIPIREPARILIAPGATLVRNVAQQSFTVNATIVGLETPDGFVLDSPSIEPLVGGTISISGSLLGGTDTLVGTTFGATTLNLTATAGTDELSLIGTYTHNLAVVQDEFKLGGVQGVIPMDRRSLTQAGTPSTTRLGVVSPTLNAIDSAVSFAGSALSLVFEVPFSGDPVLEYIAVDYDPVPTPPQTRMATDGAGGIVVGVIATGSNAELYNLFSPMPTTTMPGDGPFFGLDLSPFVLENAMQPLGAIPFHVTADANGAWFWGLPPGSIPPLTLDLVTLAVTGGQISYQSPVQRLVF